MMDNCRTVRGPQLLDAFLRNPFKDRADILQVQESLSIINGFRDQEIWPFTKGRIEDAEKYLSSNILLIEPSSLGLAWVNRAYFSLRRPGLSEILHQHVEILLETLSLVASLPLGRFSSAPGPLGRIGKGILSFLAARLSDGMTVQDSIPAWRKASPLVLDGIFRRELKPELRRLIGLLHELDMYCCLAGFNRRHGLVNPEILAEETFHVTAEDLHHLFLLQGRGNDIQLGDGRAILFLTGPNMAGKSTLLKSVGLAVYLGHLGLGVPAKRMALSVLGGMITSISISDSLSLGNSYYMSEVKRVKEAALLAGRVRGCLLLFDETFKGTNVKDASDATSVLVKALARLNSIMAIISSHLHEVAEEVSGFPNVVPMKMEAEESSVAFAYRLEKGVSTQRLGMRLLEQQGVLDLLESLGRTDLRAGR